MAAAEFSVIDEFFTRDAAYGCAPVIGIGDDCAVLDVPRDQQLAVSTDTLVEGVHFLAGSDPQYLGHKVLAVNLSDLAAMGARPAWVSLAITMPVIDKQWLASFTGAFFALADRYSLQLIGGDTTSGPLSITINIMGLLSSGQRLTRSGAAVGDDIYVSGSMGCAGLGLVKAKKGMLDITDLDLAAYLKPEPCIELGLALLDVATSCIDVSDGLAADLSHVLKASGVGARVEHTAVPVNDSVMQYAAQSGDVCWPYSCGDDYQLCFTVPKNTDLSGIERRLSLKLTKIGCVEQQGGLRLNCDGDEIQLLDKGYEHFSE